MTTTTKPQPDRLTQLRALRAAIDVEIERETRYQQRIRRIRTDIGLATSRRDWTRRTVEHAAAHFDVLADEVYSESRRPDVVRARQVAMWLLRESGRSFPEIGQALGRDHTTALWACKRVEKVPDLLTSATQIRRALHGDDEGVTA